jgi:hypothetical protein
MSETAQAFAWIQSTLQADSAWVAASTGGLAQGFADIGTVPPYTRYMQQSNADSLTMNARRLFARGLFLIVAVGPTSNYAALVTIADRIDALFGSTSSVALSPSGGILESYREQSYAADYPVNGQAWSELGGLYQIDVQAN